MLTESAACPLCGGRNARPLYQSPAGRDSYARAAEIPPDTPITSSFCLSCGTIFSLPRMLGRFARNVYSKNLAVHPHGAMNFRKLFQPHSQSALSPSVLQDACGRALRDLRSGRIAFAHAVREALTGRRRLLEARLERDFGILQSLLAAAGRPGWATRTALMLGCPLMSFMALALSRRYGTSLSSFVAFDENYWNGGCRIDGRACVESTPLFAGTISIGAWERTGRYDFIYAAQALDHAYDTAGLMRRLAAHVDDGGLVCVQNHTFFERAPSFGRFAAQHALVFTERSWRNLLRLTGYGQLAIHFEKNEFYALLVPNGDEKPMEPPSMEDYEAVANRVGAPRPAAVAGDEG